MRAVFLAALIGLCGVVNAADQSSLLARVRQVAAALPWLDGNYALYGRDLLRFPNAAKVDQVLDQMPSDGQPADIRPLLQDPDPKVRTLGMILLYRLNRLDVLPDIAGLVGDTAPTFPQPALLANPIGAQPKLWPMQPVNVGDYARVIVGQYVTLTAGDMKDPAALAKKIKQFADRRAGLVSIPELKVAMDRATGRVSPLQPECIVPLRQVLSRVDRMPMPRRFFVMLALGAERYREAGIYSDDYVLSLARQVPRDLRLAAINNKPLIDDPDVDAFPACKYFLQHAIDLLRASDEPMLLQIESDQRRQTQGPGSDKGFSIPQYAIAAAALRPDLAESILTDALHRFSGPYESNARTAIATALAQVDTDSALRTSIDWFFAEQPERGTFGFGREGFLENLQIANPACYRRVVARIVRDPRLPRLGVASTRELLVSVEGYLGQRLSTDGDIRQSMGISEFEPHSAFPPLTSWQKQLQSTVAQWDR